MSSLRRISWPAMATIAALALFPARPIPAQEPVRRYASAFLPADHWAIGVARRLATLGLASPDFGWGDGSLTIEAVGRVLHDAPVIAQPEHPELVALAQGYWVRFAHEFPATAYALTSQSIGRPPISEGWASAAYSAVRGRIYPVRSLDNNRDDLVGPFPRRNLSEADIEANLSLTAGPYLAASIAPEHRDGEWAIREGYLLAAWHSFGIWGGRRAPDFATGTGGGIVINGTAAFTGGGITTMQPFHLPWVFRHVGAIRFETFLSQIDSNAAIRKPWFFATHASVSPLPRLLIGVTQAFMFSGEGLPPFTWRNFKEMFFAHGVVTAGREFENGIASGEIRFRPPVPLVPLTLYLEWGADDNHAAWTLFPARVVGAQISAVPTIPALSVGLEHASFSHPCTTCGDCHCEYYSTWYRHGVFKDGWTLDREPIGHPLGGEGYEWLVYGTWDAPTSRLRVDAQSFLRYRGQYNIYSPTREGRSIGGQISTVYRTTPDIELRVTGTIDKGQTTRWTASSFAAGLRWLF
jgi:hypothetical protein